MNEPGRNEPCPCGSRRKYKQCCLNKRREDPGALRLQANVAFRSGRGTAAAELLARATRAAPHNAEVHDELGLVLRELKRFDEAESACRKALALNSTYAPAHVNLAEQFKRRGRLREARDHLQSALRLTPDLETTRVSLGDVLVDLGETSAAIDLYRLSLATSRNPAPIHVRLGIALRTTGDMAGAIESCRRAVELAPGVPEAHYHLAETLIVANRAADSIASLGKAIQLPGTRLLHSAALAILGEFDAAVLLAGAPARQYMAILGSRLLELGHPQPALECYRRQLQIDPGDPVAAHFVSALSNANPDRPTDEYVQQLFDNCAGTFDEQLVEALDYTVPRDVSAAVVASSSLSPPWDMLDLGCGTGLVGVEMAKHVKTLVGVDLSPRMIERARARGIYTELICGDLAVTLTERPCYDVVVAGDVFVYVGKLDAVVPAARRTLRPGGVLAFTIESAEDVPEAVGSADYWLRPSGRFAHYAGYIRALASASGFAVQHMRKIRLRLESRQAVMGWLVLLKA